MKKDEPLRDVNSITRILNNIFNKKIGVSMLRKIYLTDKYKEQKDEMINDSKMMGTSINTINNNYIINNYGNERIDYITFQNMIEIFKNSGDYIIPKYIKLKHYNKEFPENHNIKYSKNTGCLVKDNDKWIFKNINEFTIFLFNNNLNVLHIYYKENLNNIDNIITDTILKKIIHSKLYELDFNLNNSLFKKNKIKTIIKANLFYSKNEL